MAYKAIKYEPAGDVTKLGGALRKLISIPAAGVANAAGKTAAGIANVFADDRTPDQKHKDSVDAVQQQLGGGLGSSAGSTRIGPSTPAGIIPIVSFNMGNNIPAAGVANAAPFKQVPVTGTGTTIAPVKTTASITQPAVRVARRAPTRNPGTTQNISQPDEEGMRVAAPQGGAITDAPVNAGYGEYTGEPSSRINLLYNQDEAAQPHKEALVKQVTQPITAIAQPAQQTSTVGYGHGVYELAPGQNAPPDFNNMSLGEAATYKFGVNQQAKLAGIANINSEMTRRAAQTQLETNIQPSQINQNNASARHANVSADLGIFKAPAEVENIKAVTAQHTALANETNALLDLKGKNMISEIDYRKGMLDIGNKKLGLLTKQYDARIAQMKQSKDVPDYKLIADIAKAKAKTYQEISALGALTPDQTLDMQKQNDILNLVQRHATKSSTQYAGPATTTTDDET